MYQKIAAALLESVFFRVSAVVSLDKCGSIIDAALFSTDWPDGHILFEKDAEEIWLISNHPDGMMLPDEQDRYNYMSLAGLAGSRKIRFFLASEYFDCFEADLSEERGSTCERDLQTE